MTFILAMDQGTTSCRSIVFDAGGNAVASDQIELTQYFPRPGWVEHDPVEIYDKQVATALNAINKAGLTINDISATGITVQRETTVIWDRTTGHPIMNAIVWQDRRTAEMCDTWRAEHGDMIRQCTGLETDAYFSASKVAWILDNVSEARRLATEGRLAFGTIETWLIWNLTNGGHHITDVSNASRTMMFNITTRQWDEDLLDIYGIPHIMLPNVVDSVLPEPIVIKDERLADVPINAVAGDQQSALFGQACFDTGSAKCTYGTGCFLLKNAGDALPTSRHRLLSTIAWSIEGKTTYALEDSVFVGGAVVQWLRDGPRDHR